MGRVNRTRRVQSNRPPAASPSAIIGTSLPCIAGLYLATTSFAVAALGSGVVVGIVAAYFWTHR